MNGMIQGRGIHVSNGEVMKHILVFMVVAVLCNQALFAQEYAWRADREDRSFVVPDSAKTDSLPAEVHRKLLPDHMSLIERGMWGESAILRRIGIASPLTPDIRKTD